MQENKYDNEIFFEKYSRMPRSVEGLAGAGEWHELVRLLPDFRGKQVLDLGCGFGWHCRYAVEQGAAQVTGVDLSQRMLARARAENGGPNIRYIQSGIEDAAFPDNSFDIVFSSLAFHYVADWDGVCRSVWSWLREGGAFVFSVEHPVFTAEGSQDWRCDEAGNRLCWPVDHYFEEGVRNACFLGESVTKYHRTLTGYVGGLMEAGFALGGLVEPRPDPRLMEVPGMADELRRPMMLLLSAVKRGH